MLPTKTFANLSGRNSWREKGPARKCLAQGIVFVGVRNSDDETAIVLNGPCSRAVGVGAAERAEIKRGR